jgi:hypothetical protein
MNESVTVDEAISRGHRMVNYPAMLIMFGIIGLSFYLGEQEIFPLWAMLLSFVIGPGIAWLYWSLAVPKWRLWAFDNVRNVHELKKRAIRENLIWPDESFFGNTEIMNATEKEKWQLLQDKFNKEDIFIEDFTVPEETIIYYSKTKNFLEVIVWVVCTIAGVYMANLGGSGIIWGIIISFFGAFMTYKEFKEATNTKPQIILNDKGIQTVSTHFYEWKDIRNEEAVSQGSGKNISYYLTYQYPRGDEHLQIDDYATDMKQLNKLLVLYRGRYTKKNNHR